MRLFFPLPRLVRRAGIRFRWQEITLKADMELPGVVRAAPRGDGTAALPEAPGPHALPPGCQMPPTPTLHLSQLPRWVSWPCRRGSPRPCVGQGLSPENSPKDSLAPPTQPRGGVTFPRAGSSTGPLPSAEAGSGPARGVQEGAPAPRACGGPVQGPRTKGRGHPRMCLATWGLTQSTDNVLC